MAKKRYEYSTPSLSSVLTVGSEQAKSLVVRIPGKQTAPPFRGVSPALFAIDVVTRKMGKKNPAFDHAAVIAAVDSRLKIVEDEFNGELERLQLFIRNEGIKARATYNNPIDHPYDITTPQIQRAADLVECLDKLVVLVDTLWLTGRLSQEECERFKESKTKMLAKAFRSLISTGFAARKKAFEATTPEALETQKDILKVEAESADQNEAGGDDEPVTSDAEKEPAAAAT